MPYLSDHSEPSTALRLFDGNSNCKFSIEVSESGQSRVSVRGPDNVTTSVLAGAIVETQDQAWREGIVVPKRSKSIDWGLVDPNTYETMVAWGLDYAQKPI